MCPVSYGSGKLGHLVPLTLFLGNDGTPVNAGCIHKSETQEPPYNSVTIPLQEDSTHDSRSTIFVSPAL
jgi:hypothetical protein